MPTDFSEFDWDLAVFTNRRHLPHLEQDGGIHFTTFRLADSLPWEKVRLWKYERDQWLLANPPPHTGEQLRVLCQLVPQRVHKYLDAGHGACLLCHSSAQDIVETAKRSGARVSGPIPLPTRIEKLSVNRSPHVDKKSMEQFETRTHKRLIDIIEPTAQTVDELKKLNLPSGVDITINV